ncbi:MAG: ABC transporter permease [Phycisphaerales bacterium]|nr:ABC transporter permease [Phycisphaerales bacterium]
MLAPKYLPLVAKQVWRHRTRTALTLSGVAVAMFLFCAVQAMQNAVAAATTARSKETTLIVYRENRFCPFASRLPEHYQQRISEIPGVRSVVPMKIVVNNCRASLDVITFRGVPSDKLTMPGGKGEKFRFSAGSMQEFTKRGDAAIIGGALAKRRGFRVGETFDAAGVTVTVAGIIDSDEAQDQNVAYVHLEFLQRSGGLDQVGIVTQFDVKVDDPTRLREVAGAIDAAFEHDQEPTATRPETEFVARAAKDIIELVGFSRVLGLGCLAAVLALVGTAIVLSVQDRIKEHAILQTLGYGRGLIARLIVMEGLLLGIAGGGLGTLIAVAAIEWRGLSMSVEGLSMNVTASPSLVIVGLAGSAVLGIVAGLVPAWQASRRQIAACFRAV